LGDVPGSAVTDSAPCAGGSVTVAAASRSSVSG